MPESWIENSNRVKASIFREMPKSVDSGDMKKQMGKPGQGEGTINKGYSLH